MTASSAAFKSHIEESARRIEEVESVEDLAQILKEVLTATRSMADESTKAQEQLEALQNAALATEAELAKLQNELLSASAMARHDPLTNALNRKGMDEALARELAAVRRKETPLSVSLLDVDNFKKLNDQFGHKTGDEALIHLVSVVRQCLRPTDFLGRYGGEEFLILMPDTEQAEAVEAVTRLQRNLTRNFFLAGDQKILITFSAGVAQFLPGESSEEAIKRADEAMYFAKRSGKNRVASA
jgi:diguanylate cyclase